MIHIIPISLYSILEMLGMMIRHQDQYMSRTQTGVVVTPEEPKTSYQLMDQSLETARSGRWTCSLPGMITRRAHDSMSHSTTHEEPSSRTHLACGRQI